MDNATEGIANPCAGLQVSGLPLLWVADQRSLAQCLPRWRKGEFIALDTEFVRERTYYPIPGLIQLCDGDACYLVDPLSLDSMEPLSELLSDRSVLKLMHACSEDLELFETRLGVLPEPLFDTQLAAAFLGHGLSVGYQRLVEHSLGVALDKSQTRTDWLARPLSSAQLHYAAEDVAYLPELYRKLHGELVSTRKLAWVEAECLALAGRRDPVVRREQYRQISGAWRLEQYQLAVLRDLYAWREQLASSRDLPRTWLVQDRGLLEIASTLPDGQQALDAIESVPGGTRRRYGAEILSLVANAARSDASQWPAVIAPPLSASQSRQAKQLRAVVREVAERVDIAPELVGRRRDIETLLQTALMGATVTDSPTLQGWRGELVGDRLQSLLAELGA